ncbi:PAS domain S-box protein [Pseudoroseomonas wenyumeiae]|uniref:histidine kinase n=1 Tax=Teichococcus wenyumeiae TaxID=2478470 RepID=A0A3A9JBQ5_9PROT|nr:PAS domain S-box protein [Pseudoroseomonas wenyumeiae]RMI26956.1 PAS domain S-box protein [Pseudoroseomonas wenyumeiae]
MWQAWPQLALASFCVILTALLWTVLALQWTGRQQRTAQEAEMAQASVHIHQGLNDAQQRASSLATLASQLLGETRSPLQRAALEASLETALSVSDSSLDGIRLLDAAGRSMLTVGEVFAEPLSMDGNLPLPTLLWNKGTLVLAGLLPPAAERPGHSYQAALRPRALAHIIGHAQESHASPGEGINHIALMLRDGTLLKVTKSSVEQLITSPGLASGGEVPAALSAGTSAVNRLVAPLPAVHAAVVLEASALPAQGGLRRLVLLSGALLIALQLGTTLLLLLWVGRHLRRMHLRHAEETTHIRDHALRSINDMLGSMPATLYRAEIFADRSFSITSMSENVERLTGFDQAAMLRPNAWRDRVPASDQPVLAQHLNTLYREGESSAEYRFHHADGRVIWLRAQARVLAVGQHGGADVMGYLADVSSEKMLQAQAIASAKLATLGRMASALAHEITQPISVMMLAAENALDAHETEGRAAVPVMVSKLNRILEQTQRAQSLVEHLRVFGRANDGATEAVDLVKALDGALLLSASVLKRAGIEVENLVPSGLPLVSANQVMLEQVIMNLAINARDAMLRVPEAQRRLTLRAGEISGRRIELRVTDTGRGLSPEAMARLFEPFFTTKPAGQGMGLGLSICHGIIRSFGGEITGENVEGGAAFSIRLPIAEAAGTAGAALPAQSISRESQPS